MSRPIKLFNGRGWIAANGPDDRWGKVKDPGAVHLFIGAYSQKDAVEVVKQYVAPEFHATVSLSEIRRYFNKNAWGTTMDGIAPERGMWIQWEYSAKPERVV